MHQWASRHSGAFRHFRQLRAGAGLYRLAALFLISVMLTLWMANTSVTAKSLFQSPASPVQQESPPPAPETQPPAEESAPAESAPTEAPAEPAPAQSPPTEESMPAEAAPQEPAGEPLPAEEAPPPRPARDQAGEIPPDEGGQSVSNFILDQVELIDTVVVSGAYLWLCCGVILFLLVPLFLLILYIRGRSRLATEEE